MTFSNRVPNFQSAISSRMQILVAGLTILVLIACVFGFVWRFQLQAKRKEQQQISTVASDAATSNRASVEARWAGIPTPTPAPAPIPAPPPPAAQLAVPPHLQPLYTHATSVSPLQSEEAIRAAMLGRLREKEQAAMDAPTGASDHASGPPGFTPSVNPVLPVAHTERPVLDPTAGALEGLAGDRYRSQNDQEGKRQFAEDSLNPADDYLNSTRRAPISRWVIQRGTVIPAALPSKLVSDLPGDLIAEVVRDVYDSPTQSYVEIPAGSRLVGEYNATVTYAQNRVQVVWVALYFPDGSFIDLDRMPSHAADGAVGLKDQVDNHWKRVIGGVALSSLLAAGLQVSQNRTNGSVLTYPSTGQEIGAAVGQQASQLGQQITTRNLNIQPTLKIRPGEIFAVSVKKDIVFSGPYEGSKAK